MCRARRAAVRVEFCGPVAARSSRPPCVTPCATFWFDVTKADWRDTMVLEVPRAMAERSAADVRVRSRAAVRVAGRHWRRAAGFVHLVRTNWRRTALLVLTSSGVTVEFGVGLQRRRLRTFSSCPPTSSSHSWRRLASWPGSVRSGPNPAPSLRARSWRSPRGTSLAITQRSTGARIVDRPRS